MSYRFGYVYLLLPRDSFSYNGDYIGSMSVNVVFKVFKQDGQEILFDSNASEQQRMYHNGIVFHLQNLLTCSFDPESILRFELNQPFFQHLNNEIYLEWEIEGYSKDLDVGTLKPKEITETEFMTIMRDNRNMFDNPDNYPAQSPAYFTQEVSLQSC